MKQIIVTTSWDDGHPLDFKIASLLEEYNLKGTFYIPKANCENLVMEEEEIIRRAAKLINDRVKEYQENYAVRDKQDLLAMIALHFAISSHRQAHELQYRDSLLS